MKQSCSNSAIVPCPQSHTGVFVFDWAKKDLHDAELGEKEKHLKE